MYSSLMFLPAQTRLSITVVIVVNMILVSKVLIAKTRLDICTKSKEAS